MILNKKVALITGATGVIGSCLAEHFFRAGYKLVLTGRSKDKLNDLKKKLKEDVLIYPADISNYKEIKNIFGKIYFSFRKQAVNKKYKNRYNYAYICQGDCRSSTAKTKAHQLAWNNRC